MEQQIHLQRNWLKKELWSSLENLGKHEIFVVEEYRLVPGKILILVELQIIIFTQHKRVWGYKRKKEFNYRNSNT